jgi:hypothetical protein
LDHNYSNLNINIHNEKAMRGISNRILILKRAGGWWKPVFDACESILEQGTERFFLKLVSTFGKTVKFFQGGQIVLSTRVVTRVTLVPVLGTGVFYF